MVLGMVGSRLEIAEGWKPVLVHYLIKSKDSADFSGGAIIYKEEKREREREK